MAMMFHIAHMHYMIAAAICCVFFIVYRLLWYRPAMYRFPLTHFIVAQKLQSSLLSSQFFFWIRTIALVLMVLLIGKPQIVDTKSKMSFDGIDIMLALDVSGSMEFFDDLLDRRTRLEVAKAEAFKFVQKRSNDAIGLVIFGRYALVRCPLTMDKEILRKVVFDLKIGQPSSDMPMMTMLSQGVLSAARRLQQSKSKSKVIVLLTDGAPSPGDIDPKEALKVVKELGIKIYTIGIGGQQGGYYVDSIFGTRQINTPLNVSLLQQFAQETGGKFFEAKNPKQLAQVYDEIDKLEKRTIETEIYHQYYDYFMPLLWLVIILLVVELMFATWVWFIV